MEQTENFERMMNQPANLIKFLDVHLPDPQLVNQKSTPINIYYMTFPLIADALATVTDRLETNSDLSMVIIGGNAISIYLPSNYGMAYMANFYEWDSRMIVSNPAYIFDINRLKNQRYSALVQLEREINDRVELLLNPNIDFRLLRIRLKPEWRAEASDWIRRSLIPNEDGNYFQLVNQGAPPNSPLGEWFTIDCQIKGHESYSIFENLMFHPSDYRFNKQYYDFLPETNSKSPIPYIKVNDIKFATLGYLIWDLRRLIMANMKIASDEEINQYRGKFEALNYALAEVMRRVHCLDPSEYEELTQAHETLTEIMLRIGRELLNWQQNCDRTGCSLPNPFTHQFKMAVNVLNNGETNYCLLTTKLTTFGC